MKLTVMHKRGKVDKCEITHTKIISALDDNKTVRNEKLQCTYRTINNIHGTIQQLALLFQHGSVS